MAKLARVETAAKLLWQLKVTATKEVENLPLHSIDSLFDEESPSSIMPMMPMMTSIMTTTGASSMVLQRSRIISIEGTTPGLDGLLGDPSAAVPSAAVAAHKVTPVLSYTTPHHLIQNHNMNKRKKNHRGLLDDDDDDDAVDGDVHYQTGRHNIKIRSKSNPSSFLLDGGSMMMGYQQQERGGYYDVDTSPSKNSVIVSPPRASRSVKNPTNTTQVLVDDLTRSPLSPRAPPRLPSVMMTSPGSASSSVDHVIKQCKRKRETFVGQATKPGVPYRATLRKKFSWKQYPELEQYLIENQEEYFEYSLKNYTAEQRKYNNRLTNGLLDLATSLGYVFEDFTFPMIRDRLRCYYKSRKIVK
mmetsp:Transcript_58165/g.142205  ORF Transcript_58165/g.142205 Transcript_58165/m.142205 type:complete len:358 (+) Transcript_58165:719-1792(+)|eukprot:CAMPEP_0113484456 /NCGR_PEP_ID=MMETSP0014_2-20120614/23970_1 /TAXON_ID=2857 /ORGANISM="Nitzschia sp." /LENGTH=357 /DNA_ID=CAMNT_0000378057 /DNA_START=345 /DNA_END=1418 /DNA_ORIENTATION=- /assembly_acc=CAM_ASM_000159